jgi:hypothetical protein
METNTQSDHLVSVYSDIYYKNIDAYKSSMPDFLINLKEKALDDFKQMGFPDKKSER